MKRDEPDDSYCPECRSQPCRCDQMFEDGREREDEERRQQVAYLIATQ